MKIGIIGTGGVGGYFGGKLLQHGNDVTFFARGEHLKAIQNNGLTIKSINGNFKLNSVKVTDSISDIGIVDMAIIAVKGWQLKDIAKDLNKITDSHSVIIPLQNGITAKDELIEHINSERILGGLCRIMSKIESPGVINHFGVVPLIIFGEFDKTNSKRCKEISEIFTKADIASKISSDINADLWRKFIEICVGALLAVTRTSYGELRELKETRQMMFGLIEEIFSLSQKANIAIESDFVNKVISNIDSYLYDSTSSLSRDILDGKPSELEYQTGTVVKLSKKYGLNTPINEFVYNCLLPMEIKSRK